MPTTAQLDNMLKFLGLPVPAISGIPELGSTALVHEAQPSRTLYEVPGSSGIPTNTNTNTNLTLYVRNADTGQLELRQEVVGPDGQMRRPPRGRGSVAPPYKPTGGYSTFGS